MISIEEKKAFKKADEITRVILGLATGLKDVEQNTAEWIINLAREVIGLEGNVNLPDVESPYDTHPDHEPTPSPPKEPEPPEPEPEETPKPQNNQIYRISTTRRPARVVGRQCFGSNTYVLYSGGTKKKLQLTGTLKQLDIELANIRKAITRMEPQVAEWVKQRTKDRCGKTGWKDRATGAKYASYLQLNRDYQALLKQRRTLR